MKQTKTFDLDRIRVAAPCGAAWESMTGDERARRCAACGLDVFNLTALTRDAAEELIRARTGRLCVRFYRRADGTVLTRDCPTGRRAARRRLASLAGAAFAAVLGLFSVSYGQKEEVRTTDAAKLGATRAASDRSTLGGRVVDPLGAVVPGAEIELVAGKKVVARAKSDADGEFALAPPRAGRYDLFVRLPGFESRRIENIRIGDGESLRFAVELAPAATTVVVGIYAEEIPAGSTGGGATTIGRDALDRVNR